MSALLILYAITAAFFIATVRLEGFSPLLMSLFGFWIAGITIGNASEIASMLSDPAGWHWYAILLVATVLSAFLFAKETTDSTADDESCFEPKPQPAAVSRQSHAKQQSCAYCGNPAASCGCGANGQKT